MLENFPFNTRISLSGIIGFWELRQYDEDSIIREEAKSILKVIEKTPKIKQGFDDVKEIRKYERLLIPLLAAVIPPAIADRQVTGLFKPFSLDFFFSTEKFKDLVKDGGLASLAEGLSYDDMLRKKTMAAYRTILYQFYGIEEQEKERIVLRKKEDNGLVTYYHMSFDNRFCETKLKGDLPDLSSEDLELLIHNSDKPEVWMEKLPTDLFEFSGFAIYTLTEATSFEVVSGIKEILLAQGSVLDRKKIESLEANFRSMLKIPDLGIGVSSHHPEENKIQIAKATCRSKLVIGKEDIPEKIYEVYRNIKKELTPVIIPDLDQDNPFSLRSEDLGNGTKSLALIPLHDQNELLGVLEITSMTSNALNVGRILQLHEVLPLFVIALGRDREAMRNKIQSAIKENYTSIHPSVEWRFRQAALNLIFQEESGETPRPEDIVLDNVYPLYAASDIRNSSVIRNEAISGDLISQMKLVKTIVQKARKDLELPIFGEIIFRINKFVSRIGKGLLSGDELSIIHFLKEEAEPLIRHLESDIDGFIANTRVYWNALDPDLGIIYQKRKDFEHSLTAINDHISGYLEKEQAMAQAIYPHYYEMYKTDGVEYNAYIGQSINLERRFKPLYLKNLKLWQLLTSIDIARETHILKDKLPVPLGTTHLILVHSQPLSVKFRMDEKQFDVDGAYNMRYEIVKKRIDKVHVKGTGERLTKPNALAIVYSHPEDALEYRGYLDYLIHKGLLVSVIEEFELEQLQGVSGLRALRVEVELGHGSIDKELKQLAMAGKREG